MTREKIFQRMNITRESQITEEAGDFDYAPHGWIVQHEHRLLKVRDYAKTPELLRQALFELAAGIMGQLEHLSEGLGQLSLPGMEER